MLTAAFLARFQFAMTVAYHFLYVPTSIGLGLILAIAQTRYYKSGNPEDEAAAQFWMKIFAITFGVGVATGITMEFAFGTNWAAYSRFVGDIFGAPLAAEALFAFFLESTFLGILLFGKKKVSPKFYMVSSWLVWIGSALSALWILIANSWMQTPAGYTVASDGSKAILTDFWAAALNPSTGPRYFHTVIALLIMGALIAVAIGAYHMRHEKKDFGAKTIRVGAIVALIMVVCMVPAMHSQAKEVADYQPEKLAAMEGQYETGPVDMTLFGYVDEESQEVVGPSIEGMTSWLASGDSTTEYMGLNQVEEEYGETAPVQVTFQAYHIMLIMLGFIGLWILMALFAAWKTKKGREPNRKLLKLLEWSPLFPFIAIQSGWIVTEVGRQPWIVWEELRTSDAISASVDVTQLLITIVLFIIIYLFILVMYLKVVLKIIKQGPVINPDAGTSKWFKGGKKSKDKAAAAETEDVSQASDVVGASGEEAVAGADGANAMSEPAEPGQSVTLDDSAGEAPGGSSSGRGGSPELGLATGAEVM
ncbi:MAG: cytochrome ubiquinol oxidase subunit I [Coriobacteriales bacterium]